MKAGVGTYLDDSTPRIPQKRTQRPQWPPFIRRCGSHFGPINIRKCATSSKCCYCGGWLQQIVFIIARAFCVRRTLKWIWRCLATYVRFSRLCNKIHENVCCLCARETITAMFIYFFCGYRLSRKMPSVFSTSYCCARVLSVLMQFMRHIDNNHIFVTAFIKRRFAWYWSSRWSWEPVCNALAWYLF